LSRLVPAGRSLSVSCSAPLMTPNSGQLSLAGQVIPSRLEIPVAGLFRLR
jgi:hypothetical protein